MLRCLKKASDDLTIYSENYRGVIIHSPVSNEGLEDVNGLLQMGIQIFESLIFADQRNLAQRALGANDEAYESNQAVINSKCIDWLSVSREILAFTEGLSNVNQLSELDEFAECVREMIAIVNFFEPDETKEMPKAIQLFRDSAIREFNGGETQPLVQTEE